MKRKLIFEIAVVLITIFFAINIYAESTIEEKINKIMANVAELHAGLDYKNIELLGDDIHISNATVSLPSFRNKFTVNEIIIHDIDEKSDIPSFLNISFNGVKVNKDKLNEGCVKDLEELGYNDSILLNFTVEYHCKKKYNEIIFDKIKIHVDDFGDLLLSFRLGNVDFNKNVIMEILGPKQKIMLYSAKISYKDDSFMKRILKLSAKEQKKSVKQIRNDAVQNIEKEIEKERDDLVKNILKEIKVFINNPERLSISIEPKKPIPWDLTNERVVYFVYLFL